VRPCNQKSVANEPAKLIATVIQLIRVASEAREDQWPQSEPSPPYGSGIGQLFDAFIPQECANYFRNSGYASA
jgi:hypothetical protein